MDGSAAPPARSSQGYGNLCGELYLGAHQTVVVAGQHRSATRPNASGHTCVDTANQMLHHTNCKQRPHQGRIQRSTAASPHTSTTQPWRNGRARAKTEDGSAELAGGISPATAAAATEHQHGTRPPPRKATVRLQLPPAIGDDCRSHLTCSHTVLRAFGTTHQGRVPARRGNTAALGRE